MHLLWLAILSTVVMLAMGCGSASMVIDCVLTPDICGPGGECDAETRQCRRKAGSPCVSSEQCAQDDRPVCNGAICVACDVLSTPESADQACQQKNQKGVAACLRAGIRKGSCGECRLDAHCGDGSRPICDPSTFTCRACQKHSECTDSQVCNLGGGLVDLPDIKVGQCVPVSKVVFVDADRCPRSGSGPTGSADKPYCEISSALGKADFVVVRPRTSGLYGGLSVSDGKRTTIVGPGRDAMTPVQVAALSVSGSQTALVVSDITVRGDSVGASCGKDGNLWVLRSIVQNGAVGIEALGCNRLVIEQSIVSGNRSLGLRIGTGTRQYRIVNNVFSGNGQSVGGFGVFVAAGVSGLLSFNTILNNGEKGVDGGAIRCETGGMTTRAVANSIIIQNAMSARTDGSGQPLGTQFSGDCRLNRIVVGIDGTVVVPPSEGLIRAIPDLDQSMRLLSTPNNRMYVIDKGVADDSVRNDHFGSPRPKGDGYDLGAHELR
ncbi:MAG TPA: right-handed parallel beta-helix repeat-containing protein [Pseudomonadota bacterium]|nr:right-handed parallel beta-helix repeat-containing protein [Pseudomonadota bacterium]